MRLISYQAFAYNLSSDTNRLIIHFQSDRSETGAGFSMEYEMVDLPKEKPIVEVGDDLEADLHGVIEALAPQIADNHEQKLRERLTVCFHPKTARKLL